MDETSYPRTSFPLVELSPPLDGKPPCRLRIMVFSGDFKAHPFNIEPPASPTGAVR